MATYKPLTIGATPAYGYSGAAIKAYQKTLNQKNAGKAGYIPLKEDGMYGPLTQKASQFGSANEPTLGDAYGKKSISVSRGSDPYEGLGDYYASQFNTPIDENGIKSNILNQFQKEIDATRAVYGQKLKEAKVQGEGRLGSTRATQARGGLLGSDFGAAQTEQTNQYNTDINNSILQEQEVAVQAILGKARQDAAAEIAAKRQAKAQGASDYLAFLGSKSERKAEGLSSLGKLLLAKGITDVSSIDDKSLAELSKSYGASVDEIGSALMDATAAQDKVDREGQFDLSEGQARYDKNGNVIAQRAKTYAPKSGSGTGAGSGKYGGEFGATIDQVANLETTVSGRKALTAQLQQNIADGDYASAYSQIASSVEKGLVGEAKQRFANARTDYEVMAGLQDAVQAYQDAGGDTGLLKGTSEGIIRKLGNVKDPALTALAVQLQREFQTYRNTMTGAAFGPQESAEYASVNPSSKKNLNLNLAVIEGARNQLKNRFESTINSRVPSAKYIKDYADGNTGGESDSVNIMLPDGRTGTIPRANLPAAIKAGAKEI